jgi:hypothetical protein
MAMHTLSGSRPQFSEKKWAEAHLKVLSAENRSLPRRAIPELDKEPTHRSVLVVPVQDTDERLPLQGVRRVEDQQNILWAEIRKETGRWESRWKVRDLLADERCSRAVCTGLPLHYGRREAGPSPG